MRNFILGIVVAVLVLLIGTLGLALLGFLPTRANRVPPAMERNIAMSALAGCHGDLDRKPSTFGKSFYPPAPDLILDPPDDAEWHLYYVIRNGVRYTGMAAWDKTLSDTDMWKVTAFLTRINKLPPAVQDFWKNASGVSPPTGGQEAHDHK